MAAGRSQAAIAYRQPRLQPASDPSIRIAAVPTAVGLLAESGYGRASTTPKPSVPYLNVHNTGAMPSFLASIRGRVSLLVAGMAVLASVVVGIGPRAPDCRFQAGLSQ
jgi:hypothetical protein